MYTSSRCARPGKHDLVLTASTHDYFCFVLLRPEMLWLAGAFASDAVHIAGVDTVQNTDRYTRYICLPSEEVVAMERLGWVAVL